MKRKIAFGLVANLLTILAGAQVAPSKEERQKVTIGEKFSLASKTLDEERPYWVYLPASYDITASQHYPVLYLLDGDTHFHSASGVVEFMSSGLNGNYQIPELIVVALPNPDANRRTRDLTPSHSKTGFDGKESDLMATSGGGPEFLKFIRNELFPEIEKTYRTLPYRVIVGHSFGGLLALDALLEAPKMFQSYIAIDPSLWWDDQILVQRAKREFKRDQGRRGSVYISLANNPDLGLGDPNVMEAASRAFAKTLKSAASPGFRTSLQYFEAEDHGSVPLMSLYHGLLFTFEGYKPTLVDVLEDPKALENHFQRFSERTNVIVQPPLVFVNQLGYMQLALKENVDLAIDFFELNLSNHADSYELHDILARAYLSKGDKTAAIKMFEKSLELNPSNKSAKEELDKLKNHEAKE